MFGICVHPENDHNKLKPEFCQSAIKKTNNDLKNHSQYREEQKSISAPKMNVMQAVIKNAQSEQSTETHSKFASKHRCAYKTRKEVYSHKAMIRPNE